MGVGGLRRESTRFTLPGPLAPYPQPDVHRDVGKSFGMSGKGMPLQQSQCQNPAGSACRFQVDDCETGTTVVF